MTRQDRISDLEAKAKDEILILDGAMGTMLQKYKFTEEQFRGERFKDWDSPVQGNNDLLNLTQPDAVRDVHTQFIEAGADLIETNTFSATVIGQGDYHMQGIAAEIAEAGAKVAREAADAAGRPVGVLGAIGPTNKTLSLSPDVNNPGYREVTFDDVREAYLEQARAMAPYIDFFLIETIFDTLNAKAAIKAVMDFRAETGEDIPVIISGTITDASGRTLSGQTAEAFWHSIRHAKPWAVGLNCALGAKMMRPHIAAISKAADTRVIAYPNAGLPNEFGEYDELPEQTAAQLEEWAKSGLVNVLGGCCGTTPPHIAAIAKAVKGKVPRKIPEPPRAMRLSGLEPFQLAS
ncbi:homocysteine S-methyltransferase family protein [Henriciella mobilis]|uniref:Methionine synthase n=1 Tax=Henriciella mobilis TaxID=2305467 RepID=A0A399RHM8_9PROT|nr:homocysteine S-methyltransferase family protein [Henriciella mobilis]RIJ18282.1 5-methyltetrahydrofolate--homocysteine methyltransferase [Henriciella mobilis]RIJ24913.1 5-methyltetrahydrofolate--homocysteine methyltransferase [Henriciella mobilis]RIJ29974.1 5-methyltetrahydrofolate--homocysteine methyltransferase [Henriciella mobilis]